MIDRIITPLKSEITLHIPEEMVGKEIRILAFSNDENYLSEVNENDFHIPEWHKELVLAEKKRMEEHPGDWEKWEEVKKRLS